MSVLEIQNLKYVYSVGTPYQFTALNDVSLKVEKGEMLAVIGHTGSGKSTLIQHFNGLFEPTEGKVFVAGEDIWQNKKNIRNVRFKVGLCFQYPEYQLFEETVYKDISYGPKNMGLSDDEIDRRVRQAAAYMDIKENYFDKSPFDLSGGEKRRVAIAGILAMEPDVLVLDEPTAGLDPRGRDRIFSIIQRYREQTDTTIIIVSHSMEDVARFAQRIVVVNDGQIVMDGDVSSVFSKSDELKSMGLNVPQITDVFLKLKQKGYDVNTCVYTVEQAVEEINRLRGVSAK